ncbi:MAG: DUF1343 domain-containing protein [Candidatus Sumerlaeaceae bacterium]|nr:DUF1343 domain-containing protein [Candidatus Sumerlaeaceae bacterium]
MSFLQNEGRQFYDVPVTLTTQLPQTPQKGMVDISRHSPLTSTESVPRLKLSAHYVSQSVFTAPAKQKAVASTSGPLVQVESRSIGSGKTLSGLDVLAERNFAPLKGKRVALLTNHSAITRDGRHMLDLMFGHPNVNLVKIFSPEHGLYGNVDTKVSDFVETRTQLMVHSLYGKRPAGEAKPNHPRPKDLDGVDVVVVDMQDIGARFYTYCSYMGFMMEECAKKGVQVIVLDRPNPIGGLYVDGPSLDADLEGLPTSYMTMPVAHGMTMGELARMFNAEKNIGCKLTVVKCENWTRDMFYDQTGLLWVNPSPNIQDLDAAIVYPGIAITEAIVSMGRGTKEPFHVFGAPYIKNAKEVVDKVTSAGLDGMRLEVADFTPTGTLAKDHVGERKLCRGARMIITDRQKFRSVELGLRVISYLYNTYGDDYTTNARTKKLVPVYDIDKLRGPASSIVVMRIKEKKSLESTLEFIAKQVERFRETRAKYLLYPPFDSPARLANSKRAKS